MSSPKYSSGGSHRLLRDRDGWAALTDHAITRWHQRTPDHCPVSIHEAWREGEWINHPQIAHAHGEDQPPEDVRLFRYGDRWTVAFLLVADETPSPVDRDDADRVVCTVIRAQTLDHGPSRDYLDGHRAHAHPDRH